jgi:hypothetical protein
MSGDTYPIDYTILPEDIKKELPALRSQQDSSDPMVYTKFFCPWGAATWWILEYDGDDILFGFAYLLNEECAELGYISKEDLESIRGFGGLRIERDHNFKPKRLSSALLDHGLKEAASRFDVNITD